jgi:hypothetical protein
MHATVGDLSRTGVIVLASALLGGRLLPLAAQALCSAPHSSPVLGGGQSLRTLGAGAGWIQVSAYHQVSNRYFGTEGERRPFLADGEVRTSSAYLTGALGLASGIDAWAQIPLHRVRYADQSGERLGAGRGDLRLSLRLSPELFGSGAPVLLRAGAKLPGSDFPVDATLIPLSEGQRDWEVSVESGTTFPGVPLYVLGWLGYRWREANHPLDRKPGDERFAHVAVGGQVGAAQAELAVEAMAARAPRYLGVELPTAARRLLQLQPTMAYGLGPGAFELTGLFPVAGRNLPAGAGVSAGYRLTWGAR